MKRFCFLAALMLLSPSAYAGDSISFVVGGHRIQIDASRYCRSTSCASVSISGTSRNQSRYDDRGRYNDRDRYDDRGRYDDRDRYNDEDRYRDDRRISESTRTLPTAPAVVPPPVQSVAAPPPAVYRPAAAATQIVPAPQSPAPPATLAVPPAPPPPPPAPPVAKPAEPARPTAVPQISRVSHDVADDADTPVGDWQTEGKGSVRIAKCGNALCGYVLNSSSNDKGEAVLINMKPKSEKQWTGSVYSQASGDTYYGTMNMKGENTLRVEACALGRFYCSGNNWRRINARPTTTTAESLMSSQRTVAEPRS
ncbi:DUF2147 domain-containing protein [Bradyrhizobium sp. JYMT SZCCT0180]|uniref:DUF2147 domain-containing protein n=1 Tax=Bradyrhizobium sp. JYMT SZCCT0180 TaxID=2807666 RepID=UPI001BAB78F5|nr:DUF2147 domain-containing protein [Bradyrhizobium sp. JYMT SZCCT0180]MBR1212533.1 DUF2147 domain-containing protein [Bradyrhizobium sp. JYMT SZCCT0180]